MKAMLGRKLILKWMNPLEIGCVIYEAINQPKAFEFGEAFAQF